MSLNCCTDPQRWPLTYTLCTGLVG